MSCPVSQGAEDGSTQGRADANRSGRHAADRVGVADGGDQRQGADCQHGQGKPGEKAQRKETGSGQFGKPREAARKA